MAGGLRYLRRRSRATADGTLDSLWLSRPGGAIEWLVRAEPDAGTKRSRGGSDAPVQIDRIQASFDETLARIGDEGWEFAGNVGEDTYLFTHRDDGASGGIASAHSDEPDVVPPPAPRLAQH